ncbi:MAG TPA: glycoside hydrolase family 2 TIM barrel-domain containing protein [Baekduia sp.]|nr:glycoside hydrolase family 2 TIM barrel-domain containing protein [Baekduia sp.]
MLRRCLLLTVLALLALPVSSALAQGDGVVARTLYKTGNSGRYLVGGQWLFRADPGDDGAAKGFARSGSTVGWTPVTVPNAWNAKDYSEASFKGGVGWYRKDFRLPSSSRRLSWILRFESVNYRSTVYLNGHQIGRNTGAYLPFEVRIPARRLRRGGANRLVVRVDSRRLPSDFPPSGLSYLGVPTGGWWNYGGILREVYLRKVDRVDIEHAAVLPDLPCATCTAHLTYRATVRNFGPGSARVTLGARLGGRRLTIGSASLGAGRATTITRRITVPHPRIWSPKSPYLYDTSFDVATGGHVRQRYTVQTGIRSIRVVGGRLLLNGKPVHLRGFGLHEDSLDKGFAIDDGQREQQIQWAREAGGTLLRSHYPLHPYYYERLDKLGMLAWTEVPVYSVKTDELKKPAVRALAAKELGEAVQTNLNHPSIIVWSAGNELSSKPGPVQGLYIKHAVTEAKELDPTRPVGLAVAGYPSAGCQSEYGPLDVIGINDYFGWYAGPGGQIADRSLLPEYLDAVRRCYPHKAIFVTETGAEANRHGAVEERGTYEFQQDYVNYHFGVYATKPWLAGAIWWGLEEFAVRPGWEGGNPWPNPPIHEKGLITMTGVKKPAFADIQRIYRSTVQYGGD